MTVNKVNRSPTTRRRAIAVTCAVAVVAAAWVLTHRGSGDQVQTPPPEPPLAPAFFTPDRWEELLGGDAERSVDDWKALNSYTDLGDTDAAAVRTAATETVVGRFTGTGSGADLAANDPFKGDDIDASVWGTCSNIDVIAASPVKLPVATVAGFEGTWAKAAVAWTGTCEGSGAPDAGEVRVAYTYAQQQPDGTWVPVRESQIPGSGWRWLGTGNSDVDLAVLRCGNPGGDLRAEVGVAAAWDVMCNDAKKEGVRLDATSAFRSQSDQQALYDDVVGDVGESRADRWVVANTGDGTCRSRHCAGAGIDVADDIAAMTWLQTAVACSGSGGAISDVEANGNCPDGSVVVPRHLRYGFTAPYAHIPTHLEYSLNSTAPTATVGGCAARNDGDVAVTITSEWRCTLAESAVPAEVIRDAAAGAVAQARCASGLNPGAVANAGRYVENPDPRTGVVDTRAGVHMLDRDTAERLVEGGYSAVSDPQASAIGAAKLWLEDRNIGGDGWTSFTCPQAARAPQAGDFDL